MKIWVLMKRHSKVPTLIVFLYFETENEAIDYAENELGLGKQGYAAIAIDQWGGGKL